MFPVNSVSIMFQKMQSLEEDRLQKLRNSLWNYTNLCSQTLVDTDQRLEEVNFFLFFLGLLFKKINDMNLS